LDAATATADLPSPSSCWILREAAYWPASSRVFLACLKPTENHSAPGRLSLLVSRSGPWLFRIATRLTGRYEDIPSAVASSSGSGFALGGWDCDCVAVYCDGDSNHWPEAVPATRPHNVPEGAVSCRERAWQPSGAVGCWERAGVVVGGQSLREGNAAQHAATGICRRWRTPCCLRRDATLAASRRRGREYTSSGQLGLRVWRGGCDASLHASELAGNGVTASTLLKGRPKDLLSRQHGDNAPHEGLHFEDILVL
jgi:hypothetical protein